MAKTRYTYKDQEKKRRYIDLDSDLEAKAKRARVRYETSKKYIDSYFSYIWRWAYKAYSLSTSDRAMHIKSWQSNISVWIIRSFIDIMVSTLSERPITYTVTGLNDTGRKNKDNILHALSVISDATWFHNEVRKALREWLKTWMFAFRVWMLPDKDQEILIDMVTDPDNPKEISYDIDIKNFPYATTCDVFNIFPDFWKWDLQYVTERWINSIETFINSFWSLISSETNESPFKDMISVLANDTTKADFTDFWIVKYQIYQDINYECYKNDSFIQQKPTNLQVPTSAMTHDNDADANIWNVEWLYTVDNYTIVIHMNGFPVYIWSNPYWFVPYVMVSTQDKDQHIWCEWIPYLIRWPSQIIDTHVNTYIDWVRVVANPSFTYVKWAFIDTNQVRDMPPGALIAVESWIWPDPIRRIDKWSVSDFSIYPIMMEVCRQLVWVSEYNSGIAARERTATWSLAVTQSSQKRLSPFLESFVSVISKIAHMKLKLIRQFWTDDMYKQVADISDDDIANWIETLSNKDLIWVVNISLELDWMFSAIEDMKSRKLLELFNQVAWRNLVKEDELMREIVRSFGLSVERIVPEDAPSVTTEPTKELWPEIWSMAVEQWRDLTALVSPQPNFWNEWQWQQ